MDTNFSKKLKILKELDSKTDWEAAIKKETMLKRTAAKTATIRDNAVKLTKSQKKRLKLEKQQQQVQESLQKKNIETVVYSNPDAISKKLDKKIQNEVQADVNTNTDANAPGIEIDMRKTRFEIMKFGMNSLKAKDLEDAETSLALSLGAKPRKRPSINYKDLQVQRKKEREQAEEEASTSIKPKLQMGIKKKSQGSTAGKGAKRGKERKQAKGRSAGQSSNFTRNKTKSRQK